MKMRNKVLLIGLVLIISLVAFASCKPEEDHTLCLVQVVILLGPMMMEILIQ